MSFADKSTTRREFVKDVGLSAAGLAVVGSLGAMATAADTKHGHLVKKIGYNMKEMFKMVGPGNADLPRDCLQGDGSTRRRRWAAGGSGANGSVLCDRGNCRA